MRRIVLTAFFAGCAVLGCVLAAAWTTLGDADLDYALQPASRRR